MMAAVRRNAPCPVRHASCRRGIVMMMWRICLPVCTIVLASPALAQPRADVPYVTTPWNVVETMLEMAQVTAADNLIDLGAGDGRIVIEAVKTRGARGTGIELNPHLVKIAVEEAKRQGVTGRAGFIEGNLFDFDLAPASVLTMYLFPQINIRLRPRLFEQLKPGTRIVSHDFHMDAWAPDAQREVAVPGKSYGVPRSSIYLWVMPANAAGLWRWRQTVNNVPVAFEAGISQRFQKLDITATADGARLAVGEAQLRGDEIRFRLAREQAGRSVTLDYSGRIDGDALAGKINAGDDGIVEWKAQRAERGKIRLE
jgi:hypothetical protein